MLQLNALNKLSPDCQQLLSILNEFFNKVEQVDTAPKQLPIETTGNISKNLNPNKNDENTTIQTESNLPISSSPENTELLSPTDTRSIEKEIETFENQEEKAAEI